MTPGPWRKKTGSAPIKRKKKETQKKQKARRSSQMGLSPSKQKQKHKGKPITPSKVESAREAPNAVAGQTARKDIDDPIASLLQASKEALRRKASRLANALDEAAEEARRLRRVQRKEGSTGYGGPDALKELVAEFPDHTVRALEGLGDMARKSPEQVEWFLYCFLNTAMKSHKRDDVARPSKKCDPNWDELQRLFPDEFPGTLSALIELGSGMPKETSKYFASFVLARPDAEEKRREPVRGGAKEPAPDARAAQNESAKRDEQRMEEVIRRAFSDAVGDLRKLESGATLAGPEVLNLRRLFDQHPGQLRNALQGLDVMARSFPFQVAEFLQCFVHAIDDVRVKSDDVGFFRLLVLCKEHKGQMLRAFPDELMETSKALLELAAARPQETMEYFSSFKLL